MAPKTMTELDLADLLGETRAQLADALNRIELLEACTPQIKERLRERERAARIVRVKAVRTVGALDALTPADQQLFFECGAASVPVLVEMLRGANRADRDKVLGRVNWRTKAGVVFQLAPMISMVRVECVSTFETKAIKLTAHQGRTLAAAGLPVREQKHHKVSPTGFDVLDHDFPYTLSAYRGYKGDVETCTAELWSTWIAADVRLAAAVKSGKLVVTKLADDESRAVAFANYMKACSDAIADNVNALMPELPSLEGDDAYQSTTHERDDEDAGDTDEEEDDVSEPEDGEGQAT